MNNKNLSNDQGFTIVELIIATTIFAIVLVVLTFGILQITRVYYKGVTETNTQNVARNIVNDVSQAIQFSNPIGVTPTASSAGTAYGFCIGGREYVYQLGYELTITPNSPLSQYQAYDGLIAVNFWHGCGYGVTLSVPSNYLTSASYRRTIQFYGSKEFLSPRMRLSYFNVSQVSSNLYKITVQVTYGDDSVISNPEDITADGLAKCQGGEGSQFCATSTLSTVVEERVPPQ